MRRSYYQILLFALFLVVLSACSTKNVTPTETPREHVSRWIEKWPATSKEAANSTMTKYGPPNEITLSQLIWYENAPFKRIVVFKNEIIHNFPYSHSDVLLQVINYNSDPDLIDEVSEFDGSIAIDRTAGEMSSRCESEALNVLALNLANEIMNKNMSLAQARKMMAKSAKVYQAGNVNQYTTSLVFRPLSETQDPDEAYIKEVMDDIEAEEARGGTEADNLEL